MYVCIHVYGLADRQDLVQWGDAGRLLAWPIVIIRRRMIIIGK